MWSCPTEATAAFCWQCDSGRLPALCPHHDTWVDRLPLQIPAEHKGQGSVVTFEDTEVASRWPSGRLRRRQRAGRSVGHRISQWGRPRLLRHVDILLILPTSFSPRGRFCCFLRCSGRCRSTWSPRASLCGHGRGQGTPNVTGCLAGYPNLSLRKLPDSISNRQ